jgi:uncharacterized protein YjbI with pentapeptide repeats
LSCGSKIHPVFDLRKETSVPILLMSSHLFHRHPRPELAPPLRWKERKGERRVRMSKDVRIELTESQKAKIKAATGKTIGELHVSKVGDNVAVTPAIDLRAQDTRIQAEDMSIKAQDMSIKAEDMSIKAQDMSIKAQDLTSQDLTSQDLTSQDLTSQDLTSQDLTSQDLTSQDLSGGPVKQ